jgi:hypothetical protein
VERSVFDADLAAISPAFYDLAGFRVDVDQGLDVLAGLLRQGRFERHDFPVRDDPYNTIPELGRWPSVPVPHRFETAWARSDREGLQIFLRKDD